MANVSWYMPLRELDQGKRGAQCLLDINAACALSLKLLKIVTFDALLKCSSSAGLYHEALSDNRK